MKMLKCVAILAALICIISTVYAKELDEYIAEADGLQKSGNLDQAITTMEEAVKEYPENSMAYTQLGNFISMRVRNAEFQDMFAICTQAFDNWNKAIELDPYNVMARSLRGGWGIGLPAFAGMLDIGIADQEFLISMLGQSPSPGAAQQLVGAYMQLGQGYQKKKDLTRAKSAWNKVIELAPGSESAQTAQSNIDKITDVEIKIQEEKESKGPDGPAIVALKEKLQKDPNNTSLLIELGNAYNNEGKYDQAEIVLNKAIRIDAHNINAYKALLVSVENLAASGYDFMVSIDTDYRTNLAFQVMYILDQAVECAPDDIELRLHRGIAGIQMPFFVGKLDQSIDDLNMILESEVPDSIKAEAKFWLGDAYERKAMTYWIEVASDFDDSDLADMVYRNLDPGIQHFNLKDHKTPVVAIDFIMGFTDELPPQSAVWIEDIDGNFVKTIYISGFSANAKEVQVHLPKYAKSSKFEDVDAVTGASIDLGHHIYVWDVKDSFGNKVKNGDYIVKVEVCHWPHVKYQLVEAPITIGKKEKKVVVEEGKMIPYLEVTYYPKGGK
jgi:tetratricopeptide (TPR) repeat protein